MAKTQQSWLSELCHFTLIFCYVLPVLGQGTYQGTPIQDSPLGIPTLTYNCAKMPSICQNVARTNPLQQVGSGALGALVNGPYIVMHVDRQLNLPAGTKSRADQRRNTNCPGNWKSTHTCPETNQPLVVPEPFNKGGRSLKSGFTGQRLNPNLAQGAAGSYRIADPGGEETGMAWTCDEWPPAMSIEGGTGANTICAPAASSDCDGKLTRSEQDFQSDAHGTIRDNAFPRPKSVPGVFTFHFKTVFMDDDDAFATSVDFYQPASEFGSFYGQTENAQRRDMTRTKTLVEAHQYGNGTVLHKHSEVPVEHGVNLTVDGELIKRDGEYVPKDFLNEWVRIKRRETTISSIFFDVPGPHRDKRQKSSMTTTRSAAASVSSRVSSGASSGISATSHSSGGFSDTSVSSLISATSSSVSAISRKSSDRSSGVSPSSSQATGSSSHISGVASETSNKSSVVSGSSHTIRPSSSTSAPSGTSQVSGRTSVGSSQSSEAPSGTSLAPKSSSKAVLSTSTASKTAHSSGETSGGNTGTSGVPTDSSSATGGTSVALNTITYAAVATSSQTTLPSGCTGDCEITSTDSGGHKTVIPFLWHCWFCGGGGIQLPGLPPAPGIYPPPPNPPFPSFPTITIGPNSIPTAGPSASPTDPTTDPTSKRTSTGTSKSTSSSSSSSSCTAKTITDAFVSCMQIVSGSATVTTGCKTTTSVVTGCTAKATTSTAISSASASACSIALTDRDPYFTPLPSTEQTVTFTTGKVPASSTAALASALGSSLGSSATSTSSAKSKSTSAKTVSSTSSDKPTSARSTSTSASATTKQGSQCDCNEDGCSSSSPACCANGTCSTSDVSSAAPKTSKSTKASSAASSTSSSVPTPNCSGSSSFSITQSDTDDILGQWKSQFGQPATCLEDVESLIVGLGKDQGQISLNGKQGNCAKYEDLYTALQALEKSCLKNGQVTGAEQVPNSPQGLVIEPYGIPGVGARRLRRTSKRGEARSRFLGIY